MNGQSALFLQCLLQLFMKRWYGIDSRINALMVFGQQMNGVSQMKILLSSDRTIVKV